MYFSTLMAGWWLLAESAFALALEWAERRVTSRGRISLISPRGSLLLLLFLIGAGLLLYRMQLLDTRPDEVLDARLLAGETWNALCTIWVVLEASILYFLARIVRRLDGTHGLRAGVIRRVVLLLPLFAIGFIILLFPAWHVAVRELVVSDRLAFDPGGRQLHLFYIRICGVFWLLVEGACVWWLWRARGLFFARGL